MVMISFDRAQGARGALQMGAKTLPSSPRFARNVIVKSSTALKTQVISLSPPADVSLEEHEKHQAPFPMRAGLAPNDQNEINFRNLSMKPTEWWKHVVLVFIATKIAAIAQSVHEPLKKSQQGR
ncbi:hypothetical protein HHI36_021621 [Cryptolaemus montrouzieri]|uniref:Uncharacterized protein n=1 Tax=Cryptolaemus montrouzieri TaxID=559131 RepID=A0ABD2MXG6_9CUCU